MDICLSVKDRAEIISEVHGIDDQRDIDKIIKDYAAKYGVDKGSVEYIEVSFTIDGKYW